ncbi:Ferrochelatase [Porphyromonas macacae]|uniref:Ferrochelatase n=2 Tax=Porphyromonas macacae TaxID=28115 RepID=A0A379E794_9PORP|nr:Ferrochelatase [Porphyromonas macacae]
MLFPSVEVCTSEYVHRSFMDSMEKDKKPKPVFVVMNLGSPDSASVEDVRRYLTEFLMDGRVISIPRPFRWLLVHGYIARFRTPRSAKKYMRIWDHKKQSFPLITHAEQLAHKLSLRIDSPAYSAMRYGQPSVKAVLKRILDEQPEQSPVVLLPLYPHYAQSSYETAVEHFRRQARKSGLMHRLHVLPPYYNDSGYIASLAESIRPYLFEPFDKLVLSYHGIPLRHLAPACRLYNGSDACHGLCAEDPVCCSTCYRFHCFRTTELVAVSLGLDLSRVEMCFQSRMGHVEWLKPYFSERMKELPAEGAKRIVVAAPGFTADCLETLEEIQEEGQSVFMQSGGHSFTYVPCLNDSDAFVSCLASLGNALVESEG